MITSPEINELATALAAAQGEFLPIEKNRIGKVKSERAEFSYEYADLSDVMAAVRPALSKHGLAISHDACVIRDPVLSVRVTARLEHSSGQFKESSPLEIPCDGKMGAAQLIGSADTYGRRYTTCSILGVVAESDDDGNAASGTPAETSRKAPLPVCPQCQTNKSVIAGKPEYGGGFVCFAKKGGCGTKWQADGEIPDDGEGPQRVPMRVAGKAPDPIQQLAADHNMTTGDELEKRQAAEDATIADILAAIETHKGYKQALQNLYDGPITQVHKNGSGRLKALIKSKVKPAFEAAMPKEELQPA